MSSDTSRPVHVENDILYLGTQNVFVLNETPTRLMKRYICSVDIKATEAEKSELVKAVRLYFFRFSQDFNLND